MMMLVYVNKMFENLYLYTNNHFWIWIELQID